MSEQEIEVKESTEKKSELSNSDVRNHPIFLKVTGELDDLRKRVAASEEAAKKKADEEALKKAEEEGQLKSALESKIKEMESLVASHRSEIENINNSHAKEIREATLRSEFIKRGCSNETFIKGAILSYSDGDLVEFVTSLASDEANSVFFAVDSLSDGGNGKVKPPINTPVRNQAKTDWKTVQEQLSNGTADEQKSAKTLIDNYMDTHDGELPF